MLTTTKNPAHAMLAPSAAHRWMRCPGSVALTKDLPEGTSEFAEEGTRAHEMAAATLDSGAPVVALDEKNLAAASKAAPFIQQYVDFVRESFWLSGSDAELLVEKRVPIDHLTGESGAAGTADAVIVMRDGSFTVIDLKFGQGVEVEAEENEQLMMYASGVKRGLDGLDRWPPERVRLAIHQPRISFEPKIWDCPPERLTQFEDEARRAAFEVHEALMRPVDDLDGYLRPGEKQCRFCDAKATCPALRAEVMSTVFDAFDAVRPTPDDAQQLSETYGKVSLIQQWCKAIVEAAFASLDRGGGLPGYKLVEGRRGNRAWDDAAQVEELLKSMRLKQDLIYKRSLISPTDAEKRLKDNPRRWSVVQRHIIRAKGQPTIVPEADPRPAIDRSSITEKFEEVVNES